MIWVQGISIHAPLAGCDQRGQGGRIGGGDFNPRTPCGVRPVVSIQSRCISDFNPRTPCGVRLASSSVTACMVRISIHAPLAGCDRCRGLGDQQQVAFQSTHPLRGATRLIKCLSNCLRFQSTHPLRGATGVEIKTYRPKKFQSTHPLRGATSSGRRRISLRSFQSTHPLRGATRYPDGFDPERSIFQSTHPLRGATCRYGRYGRYTGNFNPRTPCGVRQSLQVVTPKQGDFNPRTPCGVRRRQKQRAVNANAISIHAPLAGCDNSTNALCKRPVHFNPRTPCGVRRAFFS